VVRSKPYAQLVDYRDSPEEAAFRAEVHAWLEEHLPPFQERVAKDPDSEERLKIAADWQHELFEGGYGALGWPEEFGGRESNSIERYLVVEESAKLGAPWHLNMSVTLGWCAPAILTFGTEQQKNDHVRKMLEGREIWCQMFSEPNAGSDLAALETRAVPEGDEFVINGQKVWSSGAHWSEWGILMAKTSDGPKYQNITFFIIDMKTPGIEVRPIRQISGESDFAEIFFTDCRVPADWVVGDIGNGWTVGISTLLNERVALSAGAGAAVISVQGLERVLNLAKRLPSNGGRVAEDPYFQQRIAQVWINAQANRLTAYRVLTAQFKGRTPGPEASVLKLSGDLWTQQLSDLASEMLGAKVLLTKGSSLAEDEGAWSTAALWNRALTIGGGTSEIQKNIIAERVLGLPKNK
jgi:alkylation response protein AidB-like acyl-CoA dehydrogenase